MAGSPPHERDLRLLLAPVFDERLQLRYVRDRGREISSEDE